MTLSITNLAWSKEEESNVLDWLIANNVTTLEIALTKEFGDWGAINKEKLLGYRSKLESQGLSVISLQSLFYGKNCNIFTNNLDFVEHFKRIIEYSNILGCKYLVFGSPKNKKKSNKDKNKCNDVFMETFSLLSELDPEICIGIENTPTYYGCDFLIDYEETKHLVDKINKNNIKFHIDTACLDLSGGDYSEIFESQKHQTKSIHISSKNLASVYGDKKIGSFISSQLADYSGNMSLELLNLSLSDIKKNVNFVFSNLQKGSNI